MLSLALTTALIIVGIEIFSIEEFHLPTLSDLATWTICSIFIWMGWNFRLWTVTKTKGGKWYGFAKRKRSRR